LSDPESFRYFEPFIARDRTVKEAAEAVGCNLDTMLYRVRKFLNAGLLKVTRVEKRAGRPIKHYRSTSEAFFVPFEVTPYAELEERLEALMRARLSQLPVAERLSGKGVRPLPLVFAAQQIHKLLLVPSKQIRPLLRHHLGWSVIDQIIAIHLYGRSAPSQIVEQLLCSHIRPLTRPSPCWGAVTEPSGDTVVTLVTVTEPPALLS
jgi:hypothetical protein